MSRRSLADLARDPADGQSQLKAAGADFFDPDWLAAHMRHEFAAAPPQSTLWPHREKIRRLFLVALTTAGFTAMGLGLNLADIGRPSWEGYACLGLLVVCVLSIVVADRTHLRGPAQWHTYVVNDDRYYSDAQKDFVLLPPFAREVAANIKAMRPSASFEIDVLEQDKLQLDPVLYVVEDAERTPIKVWRSDKEPILPRD